MLRLLLVAGLLPSLAGAHSRLTSPVPRNDFDDIKDSNALHPPPCGGPRSTTVRSQQVGDSILVAWDEIIDHLGHYEILFSPSDDTSDASFTFLTDPNGVTLNNIPDVQGGTLPHHYTQMVKLPLLPCAACTLQLKQYMQGAGYYHSCADMELRAAMTPAPDAGTPDLAPLPQAEPSTNPEPSSDPPSHPDMAVAPRSGELEID
jgi:hypothetical protein